MPGDFDLWLFDVKNDTAPLKSRPYGAIEIEIGLLLLLLLLFYLSFIIV